jgi:hypothetical protein
MNVQLLLCQTQSWTKKAESASMARNPKPDTVDRLINQALAIEVEDARDAGALGFMARAMVQATLPHRKVAGNEFERRNGAFTLSLMAPSKIGLPYGTVPRLLLAWLTTEAVKTQSRELELGESLSGFMRQLDMLPTGGRWGSITRLKDQTARLFASTVSATYVDTGQRAEMGYRLTDKSLLWWDAKGLEQAAVWRSTVTLTEPFYREIVEHPIPVDMRAIQALKRSPMALDIYCWLTYRASYAKKPSTIPWQALAMQFGSDYARVRDFKSSFLAELRKVATVYGGAQFEAGEEGLVVKPSLTHIGRKSIP